MSEIHAGVGGCHASRGSGNDIARTADWLYLSAAPTFAMMALLTAVRGGPADLLCSAGSSPLSGMTPMYLLMSAFHLAPWLKLFAGLRGKAGRS